MSNNYYVYEHWRPDKNVCFYVGKGKGYRAWHLYSRSRWHQSITSKLIAAGLALDIRIIARDLSNEKAIALEIERIALYGRENLVNLSSGGEGVPGRIASAATKAKLAKSNTGKRHTAATKAKLAAIVKGTKKGPPSAETRAKISAANRRIFSDPRMREQISERQRGVPKTAESRHKMSLARLGKVPWNKGVSPSPETRAKISATLKGNTNALRRTG
jgi:hypothetical protein